MQDKKIELHFTEALYTYLGDRGFDPVFGARPLKRLIQTEILNGLARKIISQEIKAGASVTIDIKDHKVIFN